MSNAITNPPPVSAPQIDKTPSIQRDSANSASGEARDFGSTLKALDKTRAADAAKNDPEAATVVPELPRVAAPDANTDVATGVVGNAMADALTGVVADTLTDAAAGTVADALADASALAAASAGDPGATAVIASVLNLPVELPRAFAAVTATQLRPDARIAAQFSATAPSQFSSKSPATAGPANRAAGPAVATAGPPLDDASVAPDADPVGPTPPAFKLDASLSGGSPLDLDAPGLDTSVTPAVGWTPQQTAQAAALHERPATGVLHLDTQLPLQTPRFAEGFGQQVVVLAQNGIQQAQMSLNPPELGPIDVRITFHQNEASVQIAAASGLARETIQEALPRLRELMDSAGVRLNDAGVFAQLPQREQSLQGQVRSDWLIGQRQGGEASFDVATETSTLLRRVGLIDAYA